MAKPKPKHVELHIKHHGPAGRPTGGWRISDKAGNYLPNTPVLPAGTTVNWHSPDTDARLVFFKDSSFEDAAGKPVKDEVVPIPKGRKTAIYTVVKIDDLKHDYAALAREKLRGGKVRYTYVRGANSPPGIIVLP